jgi:toxin ParE1/3/4
MTRKIIRPQIVDEDLAGLAQYIARDNAEAALRFLEAAELAFQKLAEMPGMAGLWESPNPRLAGIRVWSIRRFENYLVFYRPIEDGIELVRILRGSRNIERVLGLST